MKVTDDQLDYLAGIVARGLNDFFDAEDRARERARARAAAAEVVEGEALRVYWSHRSTPGERKHPALCRRSSLDFLAWETDNRTMLITADMSKRWPERFEKHLLICQSCPIREECLDIALRMGEEVGIWGGTLPHERLEMG